MILAVVAANNGGGVVLVTTSSDSVEVVVAVTVIVIKVVLLAVDWNIMSDEIGFIFGFGYGGSVLAACGLYSVLCLSPTES